MGNAQPLNTRIPIVNPDGTPTLFFARLMQQFSASTLAVDGIAAGDGIAVTPGPTVSLDASLNDLTDVDTETTPPTLNQKLGWDGSLWVPQTGGGGGSWTLVEVYAVSSPVASVDFTDLDFTDLLIIANAMSFSVSAGLAVRASVDNGATFFATNGDYEAFPSSDGVPSGGTHLGNDAVNFASSNRGGKWLLQGNVGGSPLISSSSAAQEAYRTLAATTDKVNAIRVFVNGSGNMTAGNIYILAR